MDTAGIKIWPWDKPYDFNSEGFDLKAGDKVVVKTDLGCDSGVVVYLKKGKSDSDESGEKISVQSEKKEELCCSDAYTIVRKFNAEDERKRQMYDKKKPETIKVCKELIVKQKLPMKLIDVHFSLDGSRVIFAFTAESRVDFRNLVRELTRKFQKSIRLQQIGSRDVVRETGGVGMCGRDLCCMKFLKELSSITTDMARVQQMSSRGSERISGMCGRLLCCLAYEEEQYKEWDKEVPGRGSLVKCKQCKGRVVDRNLLKQSVKIRDENDEQNMVELPVKEVKVLKWVREEFDNNNKR